MNKRNLAIIPARSGSKGLPDKNIKQLQGKPLLAYTIEAAHRSGCFTEIMVSTDSEIYADIAQEFGARVPFLRSDKNSSDSASSWDMVREVLDCYGDLGESFDTITLLQPTSPFRNEEDIKGAFSVYDDKQAIAVVSVCETDHPIRWCGHIDEAGSLADFIPKESAGARQNYQKDYRLNGAIYIVDVKELFKDSFLYREGSYAYVMSREHSLDIDTEYDFILAEYMIQRQCEVERKHE